MSFSVDTISRLATADTYRIEWFIWITARNLSSGLMEDLGLWSGDDAEVFTIEGESRTYQGALGRFTVGNLIFGTGTLIRTQEVSVGPLTAAVQNAINLYELRFAPAEIHAKLSFNDGHSEICKMFKGFIDKQPMTIPGVSKEPTMNLGLVSTARLGTRSQRSKKSDESQKERNNDRIRRYGDISGTVPIWWGEVRSVVDGVSQAGIPARVKPKTWGN